MISKANLPAFSARDELEELREEAARVKKMSFERRGELIASLCAMAMEQIATHPNPKQTLRQEDSLSAESVALLARLRDRYRSEQHQAR